MKRLVIVGPNGFIGAEIRREAERRGLPIAPVPRGVDPFTIIEGGDVVAVCALDERMRTGVYDPLWDLEGGAAQAAAARGARTIMLSTRRVYAADVRWGARETDLADGDETVYGRNKAMVERAVLAADAQACVLRLSNVLGFEWNGARPRGSFFGRMMWDLRSDGVVKFDMAGETRRDFVPVGWVASGVIDAAIQGLSGIYNLGSGPLSCGGLAEALIAGYGQGALSSGARVSDEFYLDTSKWLCGGGRACSRADVLEEARNLGRRLRNA
jgi:nucleoside-diphosphate-sugar epimerase